MNKTFLSHCICICRYRWYS